MAGRIVVFGATGYTGEQTARALVAGGARPVLAARSRERLEPLAAELGGLEVATADIARPETVRALIGSGDVLLSTVGPFTRYGEPAVLAAIDAGATYIDSTGEPAFIRRVFEQYGPRAAAGGAVLLTAFGYDWVPGNLAGALALRDAGAAATRVEIAYFTNAGTSGGTQASTVQAMLEPSYAYHAGRLEAEPAGRRATAFTLPGGMRALGVSAGGTEHFGLPAIHPGLRDVDVYIGQNARPMRGLPVLERAVPVAVRAAGAVTRVPGVRARVQAFADKRLPGSTGGPDAEARARSRSTVLAAAYDASGGRLSEVVLTGVNPYTFTFEILAWGARRLAGGEQLGRGALAPSQAFSLDVLEAGAREAGLQRAV